MGREIDFDLAMVTIERGVHYFVNCNPYLLRWYDREDLVNEIIAHFLEKGLIEKYNPEITSFEYHIAISTKNHLIDLTRKRIHLMRSLSDKISQEGDSIELIDAFASNHAIDAEVFVALSDLFDAVPDIQCSPAYDLSWRTLFSWVVEGKKPKEMSKDVLVTRSGKVRNLSPGRISALIKRLRDICAELIEGETNRIRMI